MPEIAAIALGSNLGDREQNLRSAARRLAALGKVVARSTFLDTAPVGFVDQPRFLNGVLLLDTELPPEPLLGALLKIEQEMGRVRSAVPPKGPRLIDLDLIFYGELVLETPQLTLPHPAMQERLFVLQPLAELAPLWRHPRLGLTVQEMLSAVSSVP